MTFISLCNSCYQSYQLTINEMDAALLGQVALSGLALVACPRRCGGYINIKSIESIDYLVQQQKTRPIPLTGRQLWVAIQGRGMPDEIPEDRERVEAMLLVHRINATEIEEKDGKIYLHSLTLDNGYTVHLGLGGVGPYVVKITKEVVVKVRCHCGAKEIEKGKTYIPCSRAVPKSTTPLTEERHSEGGCRGPRADC